MAYSTSKPLVPQDVRRICDTIRTKSIGYIGDVCLDIYWKADMRRSELSRETPHFPLPVVSERMQLGAGGNVLANLAALQPDNIRAVGVYGDDWRGDILEKQLCQLGLDGGGFVRMPDSMTYAYAKPIRCGISEVEYEDPRLDFLGSPVTSRAEEALLSRLEEIAGSVDVLCVSDQYADGCITPRVREALCRLAGEGLRVVVDSRDHGHQYRGVILKPNEVEGIRALHALNGAVSGSHQPPGLEEYLSAAQSLAGLTDSSICMTLGSLGSVQVFGSTVNHCPTQKITGEIDFCGAGDTFLSAFSCALAAGSDCGEAAMFATLAAAVTIRKLKTTGTATRDELLEQAAAI